MPNTPPVLTQKGITPASSLISAGGRARIDPGLRSQFGEVLPPNEIFVTEGLFQVVSVQNDGTFDVQNISSAPAQCAYTASFLHSLQYNQQATPETSFGPNGTNPSPLPPVSLGGGSVGYDDSLLPQYRDAATLQAALDRNKKDIQTLVFRPNAPPGSLPPNTFRLWPDLYAAYQAQTGPIAVRFVTDSGVITIPSGTYTFKRGDMWLGCCLGPPTEIRLADGCLIRNLYSFDQSAFLVGLTTALPQLEWTETLGPGGVTVVTFQGSSGIANEGTAPIILWEKDVAADGLLIVGFNISSRFERRNFEILRQNEGPAATQSIIQFFLLDSASVDGETIRGGVGNCALAFFITDASSVPSTNQPNYAQNLALPSSYILATVPRLRLSSAPRPTAGLYTINTPGEIVLCEPDGSLTAIDLALPEASAFPGAICAGKRNNADIATVIDFSVQGGGTIDGALTFPVPLAARACVQVISDGTEWKVLTVFP